MKTRRVHISLFGRFRPSTGIADDATVEVQDSSSFKSRSDKRLLVLAGFHNALIRNAALLEMANRDSERAQKQ